MVHIPDGHVQGPCRTRLLAWGQYLAEHPERHDETYDLLLRRLQQGTKMGVEGARNVASVTLNTAYQWAIAGFPCIQPTHKLAASLMATHLPPELIPDLHLPWPSVTIQVPEGLIDPIPHATSPNLLVTTTHIGLSHTRDGGLYYWAGGNHIAVGHVIPLHRGVLDLIDDSAQIKAQLAPAHARAFELYTRLLIGCLIELDTPTERERITHGAPRRALRRGELPSMWSFLLKRDVQVDLRPWVKAYARGEKRHKSPAVQTLVRGHWRLQPHGPGNTLRKWVHIEPYWRGEEGLPIAMRSHRIG